MDIEQYISSGTLEAYVLGQLSQLERADVEAMAAQHVRIKEELQLIETALEFYANSFSTAPPIGIRQKLLQSVSVGHSGTIVPLPTNKKIHSNWVEWLAAASVTLAIIFGCTTLYFYSSLTKTREEVVALRQEKESLAVIQQTSTKKTLSELAQRNEIIAVLRNEKTTEITLKGQPIAPAALAKVYWNISTGQVFLDLHSLPQAPAGKQYQLWALNNGKPLDAGVFVVTADIQLQKMKSIQNAQAFAITLENAGGSPVPDLNALYLIGNI